MIEKDIYSRLIDVLGASVRSSFVFGIDSSNGLENLDNSTIEKAKGTWNIFFTGVAIEKPRQFNIELRSSATSQSLMLAGPIFRVRRSGIWCFTGTNSGFRGQVTNHGIQE